MRAGAYVLLEQVDRAAPLEPADLEWLATAAYLTGHEEESTGAWGRERGTDGDG